LSTDSLRDTDGYLIQPETWNKTIANTIAKEEGIELNDTYWTALDFMREYYRERNIAPDVRHLITHFKEVNQCSKKEAKQIVFDLFPYGYVQQACKIAGMKKPRAWSTG